MPSVFLKPVFATVLAAACSLAVSAQAADDYTIDAVHSGVNFKIMHSGLSWIHGRFNEFSGEFSIDSADPAKCSFGMNIKTASIDTGNQKRDDHLRAPDFFNAKQYPAITFKSTSVKAAKNGYDVTGELTMHGVTKPVTFNLTGGKSAEFPKGTKRTGYSADFVIKRSDFGVGKAPPDTLGDEVHIAVSFQGPKK